MKCPECGELFELDVRMRLRHTKYYRQKKLNEITKFIQIGDKKIPISRFVGGMVERKDGAEITWCLYDSTWFCHECWAESPEFVEEYQTLLPDYS